MKLEEYLNSRTFFKKTSSIKRKGVFDLAVALVFLCLSVAVILVIEFVPESVKHEGWFIAVVTSVTIVCCSVTALLEIILFRGKHNRYSFDVSQGVGVLLSCREHPVDMKGFIKDYDLIVPVRYSIQADEVVSISFGETSSLDLSMLGGADIESAFGLATLPVFEFLEKSDLSLLSLRTLSVLPSGSDGAYCEVGDPVFLVRNGKWTLLGSRLRQAYWRTKTYLTKLEATYGS